MRWRPLATALLLVLSPEAPGAGVVVLANDTGREIEATASAADGSTRRLTIPPRDLVVLNVAGSTTVTYVSRDRKASAACAEGSAYTFSGGSRSLRLEPLFTAGLARPAAVAPEGVVDPSPVATLPVKILVDDQEPAVRAVWEARLRKRVAAASEVLEKYCRVRLEVVAVGTWESSFEARDFDAQLADFERKVSVRPARLAIGFSSRPVPQKPSAAAPAQPLRSHILIGEYMPLAEYQRLEVLLHELGHYLGAVHSRDAESVMRQKTGIDRSMTKDFRVGYDPLNTLAMNTVAREAFGPRPPRKLGALSPAARSLLARLYRESARLVPEDPTSEAYIRLVDEVPSARPGAADPLVDGARAVVAAVVAASDEGAERDLSGDRQTERCVRAAAVAASKLPEGLRVQAFLLGLAVALDTSDVLRKAEATRGLWTRVEDDDEREERLRSVGTPTLHGRHALARHFVIAAALTSVAGARAAEPGGMVGDLFEAGGQRGFNFAEMAADLSGGAFARALAQDPAKLGVVADSFMAAGYVLPPAGIDGTLSAEEFSRRYGAFTDDRFRRRADEIRRRVARLPGYTAK